MKPIQVIFWKGYVMGGGCGISVNAPIRISTETTKFAMLEWLTGYQTIETGIATHYVNIKDLQKVEDAIIKLCDDKENVTVIDVVWGGV